MTRGLCIFFVRVQAILFLALIALMLASKHEVLDQHNLSMYFRITALLFLMLMPVGIFSLLLSLGYRFLASSSIFGPSLKERIVLRPITMLPVVLIVWKEVHEEVETYSMEKRHE